MSFSQSSTDITLDGSLLKARCMDLSGTYLDASIDLNNCIANIDGELKWQANGDFIETSRIVCIFQMYLECDCKTKAGSWQRSSVYLDERIANCNGSLVFTFPGAFSISSTDIKLEGTQLKARCRDRQGSYQDDASIELNNYIANIDGELKWLPNGDFIDTSRNLSITGSTLKCESRSIEGSWRDTSIELDEKISNYNGKLIYRFEHAIVHVKEENEKETMDLLKQFYEAHKGTVSVEAWERDVKGKKARVIYLNAGVGKDEGIMLQVSAEASASVFNFVTENSKIKTVSFDVLQAKVGAWASQGGLGVGISANLIDAEASVFDATLGVGLDTEVGVHDDSFTVEVLGTGITLGRKVGISVLGSHFGIDFGRCSIM